MLSAKFENLEMLIMHIALKHISSILIICFIFTSVVGCSLIKTDSEKIEERINEFSSAYNSGDFDGVLDCLDSKTRNTLRATLNITQGITGMKFNISDLFSVSVGVMSENDILNLKILKINITDKENATVNATMNYKDKIQQQSNNVVFTMVKEKGNWYIKDLENK